jgi:cytochrome b561
MWPASNPSRTSKAGERGGILVGGPRAPVYAQGGLAQRDHHSVWTIALHWASVLSVVVLAVSGLWREVIDEGPLRIALLEVHKQSGLFVLIALVARVSVRLAVGMADFAGDLPILLRRAAQLAHLALYSVLLLLPLLGLAVSNAHGVRVKVFGVFPLPSLVEEDADLADTLTDYHIWGAWVLLVLVGAHIGAACWHHWVRRDGVLAAMLPVLGRKR